MRVESGKSQKCFEAASHGSEQALFELGEMYWWGKPGKDVKKAIHYYELAADKGDKDAQHALLCLSVWPWRGSGS